MEIPRMLRRAQARDLLGVTELEFEKLVKARAIRPRYWPRPKGKPKGRAVFVEIELVELLKTVARSA